MATPYIAKENECLCIIAIREGGFLNCDSLRNAPGNEAYKDTQIKKGEKVNIPDKEEKKESEEDKKKHKHKKKNAPIPQVRFVHGSKWKTAANDTTLKVLQISNFPTDKGGIKQNKNFPNTSKFNANANVDPDTFRIEVVDAEAKKKGKDEVEVQLEVLKPVYNDDGSIKLHEPFKTSETTPISEDKYKIKVKCKQIKDKSIRYRSKYMRLVVDEEDFNAAPGRTLLIPSIADGTDGDKDKVEILDEQVRAEYDLSSCPKKGVAAAKCVVYEQLPIGEKARKKRVKLVTHILRDGRDGTEVVTIPKARKACLQYIRQVYAQAELSVKLLDPKLQLIQPPKNMIVIENKTGRQATGGKKVKIRIKIDAIEKNLEYTTGPKDSPIKSAGKIVKEIKQLFKADFPKLKVVSSKNRPVEPLKHQCSSDILVGEPQTQEIELEVLEQNDPTHIFEIAEINSTTIDEFNTSAKEPYYVGTVHERVLLKNYDSGKNRIELFFVEALSQDSLGESFWPSKNKIGKKPKRYRPIDTIVNSVIATKKVIEPTDKYYITIPHEMGHILFDTGNHVKRTTDVMYPAPTTNNDRDIKGTKRFSDENLTFDDAKSSSGNPVTILRNNNKELIDAW